MTSIVKAMLPPLGVPKWASLQNTSEVVLKGIQAEIQARIGYLYDLTDTLVGEKDSFESKREVEALEIHYQVYSKINKRLNDLFFCEREHYWLNYDLLIKELNNLDITIEKQKIWTDYREEHHKHIAVKHPLAELKKRQNTQRYLPGFLKEHRYSYLIKHLLRLSIPLILTTFSLIVGLLAGIAMTGMMETNALIIGPGIFAFVVVFYMPYIVTLYDNSLLEKNTCQV